MKTLEKGQDKIQKICDQLRRETIDPAKTEAQSILEQAKKRGEEIIDQASEEGKKIIQNTHAALEQERRVFHSSLEQAAKQAVEALRQEIEAKLFAPTLKKILDKSLSEPNVIANLINGLVKDIEKKGIDTNLEALIPQQVSAKAVNELLLKEVTEKLKDKSTQSDHFTGGIQIKMVDKEMKIVITDTILTELLYKYIRKDLRQMLFNA